MKTISSNPKSINDEYNNNKKFKDLLDIHSHFKTICSLASNIEGLKKQVGLHAAGMILSNENLENLVPTFECNENTIAIQYDYVLAEQIGLIKMDFLGLRTLTVIQDAQKLVNKNRPESEWLNMDAVDYDDPNIYEMISSGKSDGTSHSRIFFCFDTFSIIEEKVNGLLPKAEFG